MHKTKKTGIIDKFMLSILKIQRNIQFFEYILDKYFIHVVIALIVIIILFAICKVPLFMGISTVLFIITIVYKTAIGWHSSVVRFSLFIVIYVAIILFTIALYVYDEIITYDLVQYFPLLSILYFTFWLLISIVAKSEVAKLANEILSAFLSIIFTVGTFLMGMIAPDPISIMEIRSKIIETQTQDQLLQYQKQVEDYAMKTAIYDVVERLFVCMLPFICVTIISMTAISIKEYWLKKHPQYVEVWDSNNSHINENDTEN